MQVRGAVAASSYGAEPDIDTWANSCVLNPARIESSQHHQPDVQAAEAHLASNAKRGLTHFAELADEPLANTGES